MPIKRRSVLPSDSASYKEKLVIPRTEKKPIPDDSRLEDMYGENPTPEQMRRVGPTMLSTTLSYPDANLTTADRLKLLRTPFDPDSVTEQRYRNRVRNYGTAITAMCVVCAGKRKGVTECMATDCPLWAYRFGSNPFLRHKIK